MKQAATAPGSDYYSRGITLYDHGLYAEAIEEFRKVLDSEPAQDSPERRLATWYMGEAYGNLGLAQARMNAFAQAEESLRLGIMLHPDYADLHFHLAMVYYRQERYDDAGVELRKALEINPKYARALMYLGLARLFEGQDGGLDDISRAASLEPAYCGESYRRAIKLYHEDHHCQALELLEEVAETDVDEIGYHLEKGHALMSKEMYLEAGDSFLQAMSICPQYADVRNYLGICYLRQGLTDLAIAQFKKALEINPRFVGAKLNLATAYEADEQTDLCVSELRDVLEIEPGNPEAERRLGQR